MITLNETYTFMCPLMIGHVLGNASVSKSVLMPIFTQGQAAYISH